MPANGTLMASLDVGWQRAKQWSWQESNPWQTDTGLAMAPCSLFHHSRGLRCRKRDLPFGHYTKNTKIYIANIIWAKV